MRRSSRENADEDRMRHIFFPLFQDSCFRVVPYHIRDADDFNMESPVFHLNLDPFSKPAGVPRLQKFFPGEQRLDEIIVFLNSRFIQHGVEYDELVKKRVRSDAASE